MRKDSLEMQPENKRAWITFVLYIMNITEIDKHFQYFQNDYNIYFNLILRQWKYPKRYVKIISYFVKCF